LREARVSNSIVVGSRSAKIYMNKALHNASVTVIMRLLGQGWSAG
jgi:hypothetical protein